MRIEDEVVYKLTGEDVLSCLGECTDLSTLTEAEKVSLITYVRDNIQMADWAEEVDFWIEEWLTKEMPAEDEGDTMAVVPKMPLRFDGYDSYGAPLLFCYYCKTQWDVSWVVDNFGYCPHCGTPTDTEYTRKRVIL